MYIKIEVIREPNVVTVVLNRNVCNGSNKSS